MKEFMNNGITNSDTKVDHKTHGEMGVHFDCWMYQLLLGVQHFCIMPVSLCPTLGDVLLPHAKGLFF